MPVVEALLRLRRVRELPDDEFLRIAAALCSRSGMMHGLRHFPGFHYAVEGVRREGAERLRAIVERRPTYRDVLRVASA